LKKKEKKRVKEI